MSEKRRKPVNVMWNSSFSFGLFNLREYTRLVIYNKKKMRIYTKDL